MATIPAIKKAPGITMLAVALIISVLACNPPKEKTGDDAERKERALALGDSLAMMAQKTLLQKVTGAMAEGGPEHAVAFCNIHAMPLTDSLGKQAQATIRRVTDRPRNPGNELEGEDERALFKQIRDSIRHQSARPGYLLDGLEGQLVYYKPIVLGMPACLQCHGAPGEEIEAATLGRIKEMYPGDKATGYSLGELRGLWKITLPSE